MKDPLTWIQAVLWVSERHLLVSGGFTFGTQSDSVVPFGFLSSIATSHISAEWFAIYSYCAVNPSTIWLCHWKRERFLVTLLTHLIECAKRKKPLTLDYWGQLFQSIYRSVSSSVLTVIESEMKRAKFAVKEMWVVFLFIYFVKDLWNQKVFPHMS